MEECIQIGMIESISLILEQVFDLFCNKINEIIYLMQSMLHIDPTTYV